MVLEYEHIRMKPADNGVIIKYTQREAEQVKSTFAPCCYKEKELVYPMDKIDEAFEKFKSLCEYNKNKKGAH